MKVALVHDWLIHMRGGEKVLEALAEIYPEAVIYTLFCDRKHLSPTFTDRTIQTSFLQWLPGIRLYYRWLLPILPWVIKTLRIEEADLVISSSHCVAKGISVPVNAHHLCYCHTPMRYLWGFQDDYFRSFPFWIKPVLKWALGKLRRLDLATNSAVHAFVANSENVRERIRKFYAREAVVIYPPVDTQFYSPEGEPQNYYLVVSAFVPYKKVDLVIETFNRLDRKLLIVGSGPLARAYQKLRRSERIFFLGSVQGKELRSLYARARALIFPTEEDFGIVPVEAQACGTPVIALAKGGALESVHAGVFFQEQTPEALRKAILEFEENVYERNKIPAGVKKFDRSHFKKQWMDLVEEFRTPKESYA